MRNLWVAFFSVAALVVFGLGCGATKDHDGGRGLGGSTQEHGGSTKEHGGSTQEHGGSRY